ncbi:hypothetical protein J0X19_19645 [Hymenobacter sp. BT186]|uniref:STAS/SEC14 domain-containing protein n=1 Tax=Hymenobacter telluris TaxID=2816474 RepID=A0A939F143_9BACT|nr:hypothetical protein [Hymenobacter telluris]MBO0360185.1 hypothetical protein [Hymenobacter telluris]MBW3376212.1 hypothetical protein [Hymenobacter norwichensis]
MLASPLSAHTEQLSGHSLDNNSQDLGLLHDAHGAPLLRQLYYPHEQLLYVQWFGNLTAEGVVTGARAVLETQQKLPCLALLNDKQTSTGDWTEAMEWLEFEWMPQAHGLGLRAFAYVFAPDLNNQLASLDFVNRAKQLLSIQVFYDTETALAWLRNQRLH